MKKLNKVLAILCTSAIAVSGVAAFTACGGDGGHDHNAHLTYVSDGATQHHGECSEDDYKTEKENHTWGTNNKCTKCGEDKPAEVSLTLDKTTASVEVGETVTITATVTGSTAAVEATSGTPANATVTVNGKIVTVTGVKEGTSVITVSCGGASKTCTVTVTKAEVKLEVQEIAILEDGYNEASIYEDIRELQIDVDYTGKGTLTCNIDEQIATATYADGKVTLTAVKAGKTELVLSDGELEAKCVVEVATYGLKYGPFNAAEDGDPVYEMRVQDGEHRTSTDVYIPGYYMDENEGIYLPVTQILGGVKNSSGGIEGNGGFQGSNVVTVYLGENMTNIGHNAFKDCKALISVNGGGALKNIGYYAFNGCSVLETIDMGENPVLEEIGWVAFSGCNFKEFTVPASVKVLGYNAFNGCSSLVTVRILGEIKEIATTTFLQCTKLENLWIPASVTSIAKDAIGTFSGAFENLNVFYSGTQEQFNNITFTDTVNGWDFSSGSLANANITYNANFAELLEAEKNPS